VQIAKFILTLSVALSAFWVSGFIFEASYKNNNETAFGSLFGLVAGVVAYFYIFIKNRSFFFVVAPNWKTYSFFTLNAYILSVPVGILIGYIYVYISFGEIKKTSGEISVLLSLAAVWFPLWWSPALGILLGQFYEIRKASNKSLHQTNCK
jgi:hypothetical protein